MRLCIERYKFRDKISNHEFIIGPKGQSFHLLFSFSLQKTKNKTVTSGSKNCPRIFLMDFVSRLPNYKLSLQELEMVVLGSDAIANTVLKVR